MRDGSGIDLFRPPESAILPAPVRESPRLVEALPLLFLRFDYRVFHPSA